MDPRILVVIPAHNEEQTITAVIQELRQVAPTYDRVIVNDCSSDETGTVLDELGEKQLHLIHNLGYGQALQTGLKYGLLKGYDIIVSMDADGQHQPKDVPHLVAALQEQAADMVIGSRFCDRHGYDTPIDRRLGQLLFSHLTHILLGQRIWDTSSGFKAIRAAACQTIVDGSFMDFHIESIVQLKLANCTIVEVPVQVLERAHGRSMHSIASVFQYPIKTILLTLVAIMDAYLVRRKRDV
jgi:glycosyltransferase involved in cell wall biosynthesis